MARAAISLSPPMKNASVIEKNQITWLQPVKYGSRWITEEIGKLTIGRVIPFEQRTLEWQRRDRAIVVTDGAELLARIHLKHGAFNSKVHAGILKAIEDGRFTERGKSVGVMSAHPLRSSHSVDERTFSAAACV